MYLRLFSRMSALNVSTRKIEPQLKVETEVPPTRTLTSNGISVTLLEADLWSKFDQCTNEMIVTRSGRSVAPPPLMPIELQINSASNEVSGVKILYVGFLTF